MNEPKTMNEESDSSDDEDGKNDAEEVEKDGDESKEEEEFPMIAAENRVFVFQVTKHHPFVLVRPSDNKCVELKYSDPVIQPIQVADAWQLVVDSKSKEAGSKAKFVDKLLGDKKAETLTAESKDLWEQCKKSLPTKAIRFS